LTLNAGDNKICACFFEISGDWIVQRKPFDLSVKALIRDEKGRILIIKRSMQSRFFAGKWDLPGGKLDAGDTFDGALLREVAEETSLIVSLQHFLGATEDRMPDINIILIFIEATVESGKVRLNSEHEAYEWVYQHELVGKDLSNQIRPFVVKYLK
jgi:8-oxo-dGTP diphosphatase